MLFSMSIYITGLLVLIGSVAAVPLRHNAAVVSFAFDQPSGTRLGSRSILARRSICRRSPMTPEEQERHDEAKVAHDRAIELNVQAHKAQKTAAAAAENAGDWKKSDHHEAKATFFNDKADQHAVTAYLHDCHPRKIPAPNDSLRKALHSQKVAKHDMKGLQGS